MLTYHEPVTTRRSFASQSNILKYVGSWSHYRMSTPWRNRLPRSLNRANTIKFLLFKKPRISSPNNIKNSFSSRNQGNVATCKPCGPIMSQELHKECRQAETVSWDTWDHDLTTVCRHLDVTDFPEVSAVLTSSKFLLLKKPKINSPNSITIPFPQENKGNAAVRKTMQIHLEPATIQRSSSSRSNIPWYVGSRSHYSMMTPLHNWLPISFNGPKNIKISFPMYRKPEGHEKIYERYYLLS